MELNSIKRFWREVAKSAIIVAAFTYGIMLALDMGDVREWPAFVFKLAALAFFPVAIYRTKHT